MKTTTIFKGFLITTIILLVLILSGCSAENNNRQDTSNCNCNTIIKANSFSIPGRAWTVITTENDCTGVQKQLELNGVHVIGEKICN